MNIPKQVNGVLVERTGEPMVIKGQRWVTLVPVDEQDERLWEFSLDTGKIIKTH